MPKYIDADALRNRMEQIADESKPAATARPMREDTPSELLRYGTARAMIEWLDEIPVADVEPKRRWIPVTERLPENEDHVLCCTETKAGRKNVVIGYWMDGIWRCGMNNNVVAWMPLPELPKGETDEHKES